MAANYQEFVTTVKLNSEDAKNKLEQLRKDTERWIKERDQLINSGGSTKSINDLTKKITKAEKSMVSLEKQAHNVIDTIDNMDAASLEQLQQAEKMLNAEMRKTPQNTQYFQDLTDKLQQVKTQIAGIREQTKQNFSEQKQLNDEIANMNNVLANINTSTLSQLSQAESTLKQQLRDAVPDSDEYQKAAANLGQVQSRIKEINEAQKETVRTIDKYDQEIKAAQKDTATVTREMNLINNTLKNLDKSSVRDIEYSIKILTENLQDMKQGTAEFEKANEQLKELKTRLRDIKDESRETQSIWNRTANFFNRNWGVITQGFAAFTGLSMTVRKCVSAFAEMEEAMADTRKYTGLTKEGVIELNEELKTLDTRTSREELNALAGSAGRLGITSKDAIMDFVYAADKIKVALGDDLGDEAIDQVGKLAMAFGEDDNMGLRDAMLSTGSAINELAQNSAAKAGYLVDFTARVAGVGKQLGMTQAQIMGFGAVMDENLLQDEMASTAFSQLLTKMATDTKKFAKMAGMDVERFSKLVKEDMNGAIIALAENLNKNDFENLGKMFDDMGLDGTRAIGVLTTMVDKLDDVKKHQNTAKVAYEEHTSVVEEFNTMNTTAQAELEKAKKAFREITVELGQKLTPAAKYTISAGALAVKMLSSLVTLTTKHWKTLVVLTSGVIAYTVAVNKAVIMEKLHNAVTVIRNGLHKIEAGLIAAKTVAMTAWGIVVDLVTGKITLATAAQQLYNKVVLANPYIAAAAAIMGLTAALLSFIDSADDATEAQRRLNEIQREAQAEASGEIAKINALIETARNKALADGTREAAIRKLKEQYPQYLGFLNKENVNSQNTTTAINNLTNALINEAKARLLVKKIQEAEEKKQEITEGYFKGIAGWWRSLVAGFGSGLNDIADKSERLLNVFKYQSLDAWNTKTWIEENGYAIDALTYQMNGYKAAIAEVDDEIKILNKELTKTVANQNSLQQNPGVKIKDSGDGGGSVTPYKSEAELKKEEQERQAAARKQRAAERAEESTRRKAEAQRNKDYKEEMKQARAHGEALLLQNYLRFTQETHDLEEFRKKELRIRQESLDEQIAIAKKYHGEEASEVASLQSKKQQLLSDYNQMSYRLREEEINHTATLAKMEVQRAYRTMGSEIYQDEEAMQQRISQIELNALSERLEDMKKRQMEGTPEFLRLQNEYNEKKGQAELDSELYYLEKLDEYREQWLRLGDEKQMTIALQGLESLHKQQLISEEEYQKMKMAIQAQYAQNPTERHNEQFDANVSDAVAVARSKATGGYDKSQKFSASNNPLVGQIQQYSSTMAQLKVLYENDKITYAEYQTAKGQVTQEFLNNMVAGFQAAYDSINNVMSAASSFYAAQSQYEQNVTSKKYDKMIEKAGNNQKKQKKLEEKKQKELAKIKNKYNKKAAKIQIAQAVAQTAISAINAYSSAAAIPIVGHVLAPIAAAMAIAAGMLQIATIKKQAAAQEEGYYSGGFTGGNRYRRVAGSVHEGEFVVNHDGVNNQNLMPVLRLIDRAQQNNTIGTLTASDVTRQLGQGGSSVVAPIVNVQNDSEQLSGAIGHMNESIERLNYNLENPTPNPISVEELDRKLDIFKRYKKNT